MDSTGEVTGPIEGFELIKEGHLTMSTSLHGEGEGSGEGAGAREPDGITGNAAAQSLRRSNEAYIKVTQYTVQAAECRGRPTLA